MGEVCQDTVQIDSFIASLRACTRTKDLVKGTSIHHDLVQTPLLRWCSDALVTMYAKCGDLDKAKALLDVHKSKDVTTWTALIGGYAHEGRGLSALHCLEQMQHEAIIPDAVTYICALKACSSIRAVDKGKQVHNEIVKQGLLENSFVLGGALVDMYAKCGAASEAEHVLEVLPLRDVASWNALIAGYAQDGKAAEALNCLELMQADGILPNAVTYVCALKACAMIRASDKGKQIHKDIIRLGLLQNNVVLGSALLDMYAKCSNISEARKVLEGLPFRDVVSWSALLAAYVQEGEAELALNCLDQMQNEGILPNAVTYVSALKACAMIKDFDRGKRIHKEIARQGLLHDDIVLGNALVDMYAKSRALSEARKTFEELAFRDVVSWSSLIGGYAQEGQAEQALDCLEQMQHAGVLPNAVTCAYVLSVCSHRGLVEEGKKLFVSMSTSYDVDPSLECYTCMIDLLGRAGHIEKAVRLIQAMPSSEFTVIWHAFLGACTKWVDVNWGEWAFEQAIKVDKCDDSAYVLMANIYAAAGMEEKAKGIEAMRIKNMTCKKSG